MAITQLLSSINKSDTYPKSVSIYAPDSCGMLILMPNSEISEQQLFELPTINVKIFDSSGKVFLNKDINLSAIDFNAIVTKQADPYSVPIYDIPSDCICSITPIFDTNAFRCHNETVLNGNIGSFTTSENGIVDTNTEDYRSLLWETPTDIFDISVSFDDSNISSGGSSGGGGGGTGSVTRVAVSSSDGSLKITGSPITSSGTINISVNVDDELSDTSTKPVQNKIVTSAINDKLSIEDAVGKNTTGTEYTIDGQTVIAQEGAEIFNSYTYNKAAGQFSHAEGVSTQALGFSSHAEGTDTTASGSSSHAEGVSTKAAGNYSHAEGGSSQATGDYCHAEGNAARAAGQGSHAEGGSTQAIGAYSHAEGGGSQATGAQSHAEGAGTQATGLNSHSEGGGTRATGASSHAEGGGTQATGHESHAEGLNTIAASECQHVQGKNNIEDANNKYAFIIGNGIDNSNRSNAFAVDWDGKVYVGDATEGVDVKELKADVDDETAARQSADADLNDAIGVVAALGAKNSLKMDNAAGYTLTTHGRTFEVLADGGIKITGDTPDSSYADFYVSGTWGGRDAILNATEENCILSFDCSDALQTDNLYIRVVDRRTGSTANTATARLRQEAEFSFPVTTVLITVQPSVVLPSGGITVYPMIRRAEIKDSTFTQYAPTNLDLSASLVDIVEDIKELEDEIEKKNHIEINMEIGGLTTQGVPMESTTRARTKGFIPCNPAYGTIHFDINTKHRFAYYTSNSTGEFIAFSDWSTATDDTITWPAGKTTASLYILVGYTNDRTISSENMPKVWFDYYTPEGATVNYVAGYAIQAAYSRIQTISNFCLSAPIPVQPNTTYRAKKFRNTMTLDADLLPVRSMATVDIENNTFTTGATEHFIVFCWKDTENPQYFSEADDFVEGVAIKGLIPVPLTGKKLSLLGDSISSYIGTIPTGNDHYYNGNNSGVTSPDEMWWSVLCSKTGMVPLVINGWSGSAITQLTDSAHVNKVPMSDVSRCQALHTDDANPDVILIAGGVNDYSYAQQASQKPGTWNGTAAPVSGNSFDETYAVMIKNIQTAYPNAVIVCLSTWFTMRGTDNGYTLVNSEGLTQSDYDAAIKKVATLMRVPYIDVERCGFSRSNFYPNFAQDSSTIPTHPNARGQRIMGEYIADMIPQIVNSFTRNAPK